MNYRSSPLSLARRCIAFRRLSSLLVFLASVFIFAPSSFAQTGSINGSLNPCTISGGGTTCTTTISWMSSGISQVQVWVSLNGATATNFATSVAGAFNQAAPWIQAPPNSYIFTLYDYSSGSRGANLASITVTAKYDVSATMTNGTRLIGSNMVVGDNWGFVVTGAPGGVLVQIQWTNHTGSSSTYTVGTTDGTGALSASGTALSASIGRYTGQTLVGGVAGGDPFDTEIIAEPTSLYVGAGITTADCPLTEPQPYGFILENITWFTNGQIYGDINIPMIARAVWTPRATYDMSISLGSVPNFLDTATPGVGYCGTFAFDAYNYESISISTGGIFGLSPVRGNSFETKSFVAHSGNITNAEDIDVTK